MYCTISPLQGEIYWVPGMLSSPNATLWKLYSRKELTLFSIDFSPQDQMLFLGPNDIVNGFLSVFHFWPLIRAAKTPQTRHFVKFCGVFAAAQNHAINGAANGAAKSKF